MRDPDQLNFIQVMRKHRLDDLGTIRVIMSQVELYEVVGKKARCDPVHPAAQCIKETEETQ